MFEVLDHVVAETVDVICLSARMDGKSNTPSLRVNSVPADEAVRRTHRIEKHLSIHMEVMAIAEIQSIRDNSRWRLVLLASNGR